MKGHCHSSGLKVTINIKLILVFALPINLSVYIVRGTDHENKFEDEYGQDWVFIIDAYGNTHHVDLTELPSDQSRITVGDVYFHLYTRDNPNDYEELVSEETSNITFHKNFKIDYFNPKNAIKFVTHGWMSNGNATVVTSIRDAYLRHADINVIAVDWHELATNMFYPWAALSTRYVGKRVASMIASLINRYKVSGDQIHLIGHSLGAHVMGYAGSFSSEKISRITGLDPARPFFEIPYFGPSFTLDKSDANFIDVVHTCGGVLGYKNPIGHADFFPNNGRAVQPGCNGIQPILEACSHSRAYELFAESIESGTGFLSYLCDNWENFQNGECTGYPVRMGDPIQQNANGSYYLYTTSGPKYAINK